MPAVTRPRPEPTECEDALAHEVIGAAIEVHRILGPGLLESIYEEALCIELTERRIPFVRQKRIDLMYKGHTIGAGRLDLLVGDALVVELKTVEALTDVHLAQVLSYLRTTGYRLGLLINFNVAVLKKGIRRVVLTGPLASWRLGG
ncbi:MAG: GxxExxY protein [Planctomycetes bacterium]|nr:GxxExxY protein [Planctomycetota bacterium]